MHHDSRLRGNDEFFKLRHYHFSRFLDCIYANGGDINETAGDGLMVIFANTDPQRHARQAVQAALAMLHQTAALDDQRTFGPISVHIGINSGLALVGPTKLQGSTGTRWTYTASGPITNIAARIAAFGEGGTALVGPETAQRVAGHFLIKALGQHQLKNIAEEVLVYRVLGYLGRQG